MKIIEKPYADVINKMLLGKIADINSICPFCEEDRKFDFMQWCKCGVHKNEKYGVELRHDEIRYGHQKPWYKHLFEKSQYWKTLVFKCHTCGAKWESDEFPFYK